MALSAAERKRRQMKRERVAKAKLEDSTYRYLRKPFFEFLKDDSNEMNVDLAFGMMGVAYPGFDDDRGPEATAVDYALPDDEEMHLHVFQGSKGSVGRAEIMIEMLIEAASELSSMVNTYKRNQLQERLKEIEATDLADAGARRQAMQDVAHITAVLAELDKNTRWTFPVWRIKGV